MLKHIVKLSIPCSYSTFREMVVLPVVFAFPVLLTDGASTRLRQEDY